MREPKPVKFRWATEEEMKQTRYIEWRDNQDRLKANKKFKTIDLTTNQRKKYVFYRAFFNNLVDHAIQCKEKWCWCRGSVFNDSLADFRFLADDNEKRLIEEIFRRD